MGLFAILQGEFPSLAMEERFSFARHTTIGCGGYADVAASPSGAKELARLMRFLHAEHIGYVLLGAGANVLPTDGRFEGVVVRFDRMRGVKRKGSSVFADAGCTGGALLRFARESGLSGFEPFAGIPMTVGGAIAMNAGVRAGYMGERVKRVLALSEGELRILSARDCRFGMKCSVFTGSIAIVRAELSSVPSERERIRRKEQFFLAARRNLPSGRSMGCAFVNPPELSAGALIEVCGLKGAREGGAYVSPQHANFILNKGGSAHDVALLADRIKETVFGRTGILLREEFRRLSPSANDT